MKWELFKNRLRKEATQQEQGVDIDALWSAIEPDVDALNTKGKRKRRFVFWFFFGGALALTAGWFIFSNYTGVEESNIALTKTEQTEDVSSIVHLEESISNKENANSAKEETGQSSLEESQSKTAATSILEPQNNKNRLSTKKEKFVDELQKVANENIIPSSKSARPAWEEDSKEVVLIPSDDSVKPEDKLIKTERIFAKEEAPENAMDKTTDTITENKSADELLTNDLSFKKDELEKSSPFVQKEEPLTTVDSLNSITISAAQLAANEELNSKDKNKDNLPSSPAPKKKRPTFKWSVKAMTGLSYANRSLTQKTGVAGPLLKNRTDFESSLETRHYGFSIGLQHKSNLGLNIGLEQTQIAERYTYKAVETESEMVIGVSVQRINLAGDTINIMGEILETTETTIDKNIYNTYSLLDLPIIFSFQLPLKKWKLGIEAGVLANLSLRTEGIIPNELLEDQNIKSSQSNLFKSKVGLSYHLGASLGRPIGDKLAWSIAPMLRFYPTDFAAASYELSQKYVLFGGTVGLIYRIK